MGTTLRKPDHYREMAEEIRSIAEDVRNAERAGAMRKIAEDYERMGDAAQRAEDSVRVIKSTPKPS